MTFRLVKERVSDGNKKLDNLVGFLFMLGLVLTIWEIYLYRLTIINLKIPLTIWLIPGLFMTPLLYNKMNNIDGKKGHWILHYLCHTVMTGGIILFIFMALNFYLADKTIVEKRFKVLRTSSMSGPTGHRNERQPYVVINYSGFEKQLIFSNQEMKIVLPSKSVRLKIRNGFLGFDILESYKIE